MKFNLTSAKDLKDFDLFSWGGKEGDTAPGAEFLGELPGIIEDTGQAIGGGIQNLLKLVGIKSSPVDDVSSDYYESERAVSDLLSTT